MEPPTVTETTCLPAGRYEFKDAGIYIGEWLNEKAVGLGLITKDKCQGEYTGLWDGGYEKSGVFLWPNAPGAMYEGEWANNRRNGYGVFNREDWVIMGKFKDDFISIGIKCKEGSIGRFEGEFENGFPSFGVETYADGGNYAGEYKNGVRAGLGVRSSIPYGEVINFFPEEAALAAEIALSQKKRAGNITHSSFNTNGNMKRRGSLLSQCSGDAAEMEGNDLSGAEDEPPYSTHIKPHPANFHISETRDLRMSTKFKCGFVLSSQRSELMRRRQLKLAGTKKPRDSGGRRARSLTNLFNRSVSKESIACIRRQGSVTERTARTTHKHEQVPESVFTLDQVDAIDPETIEIYAGHWEADARHGYGISERTDGVMYEGQWFKNQRHGYGQTHFPDGTCEQGRYQFGKLVFLSWPKGVKPHLLLYNYHITREVTNAVKRARLIADDARAKAKEARDNLSKVDLAVQRSKNAAELARDYSLETRELVKEMYPDFEQPGIKYMEDMVRLMHVTKSGNQVFESALQAAKDVLAGVTTGLTTDEVNQSAAKDEYKTPSQLNLTVENTLKLSHGSPISRAGSYRIKRQIRRSIDKSLEITDKNTSKHELERDRTAFKTDYPTEQNVPEKINKRINAPLTLQVPQIQTHRQSQMAEYNDIEFQHSPPYYLPESDHSDQLTEDGYAFNVPQIVNTVLDDDRISDDIFTAPEKETKVSRSPSVASTYIVLPTPDNMKPQSEIPTISLAKLVNNSTISEDHFDHYTTVKVNRSREEHSRIGESLTRIRRPTNHTNAYKKQSRTDTGTISLTPSNELIPSKGLVRRRTLPSFLTQPPVKLNLSNKFHKVDQNALTLTKDQQDIENNYNQGEPYLDEDHFPDYQDLSPERTTPLTRYPRQIDSKVIYLVDEGVRKRVHESNEQLKPVGRVYTKSETFSGPSHSLKNFKPYDSKLKQDSLLPRTHKQKSDEQPLVVANVILEEPQDQLLPLPTHFKESPLDFSQTVERHSVPDITKSELSVLRNRLTRKDLERLNQESQLKYQEILARKRQGEIIIHISDIFDWCVKNMTILTFIIINFTLVYLFYGLLTNAHLS